MTKCVEDGCQSPAVGGPYCPRHRGATSSARPGINERYDGDNKGHPTRDREVVPSKDRQKKD